MRLREFHYRWDYDLRATPQALWPYVADTDRFNRDAGVPPVLDEAATQAAPTDHKDKGVEVARRRLRLKWRGLEVAWDEEPFEWIRPHRFGVVRRYRSGPVSEVRVLAELTPRDEGGTHLVYQVWARPRTTLGLAVIPLQIGISNARKFAELFRRYDALALAGKPASNTSDESRITPGGRTRLAILRDALVNEGAPAELVARLVETIERADDLTLWRLRPYALADLWGAPRRGVLELCLQATRAGLLDFRWDVLCPLCRGAKTSSASLKELQTNVHCESCNVDFTANFDRSVEVTFRPNPAVRQVVAREFCVGGPQVTPHVVAQQRLPAHTSRTLAPALEEGSYRLRALNVAGAQFLRVAPGGEESASLALDGASGWPDDEKLLAPAPSLTFENATDREQLFVLERTAWSDEAATAADVTALQIFRDLFATEALRPGDQISVGSLTVIFTDLKGSTRLYREIGDAVAFGAVMNHFDVLREAVADEGGAIIKTLGDAIMAVFRRPAHALRAVLRAQAALAAPPEGVRPLLLKAGVHTGPCIAVTLNGRLDYFGSNVNIAARLEPLSTGRDIIISSSVYQDPQVEEMLSEANGGFVAEPVQTALKGFDEESFELWRVSSRQLINDERGTMNDE